jgi:2-oxoglutarate dehydrogenase E2 component (dihydrolipoamide succinyltransferase)
VPGLGFISPVVARLAKEHAVDLNQVKGSGEGGRITKKDLLDYIEKAGKAEPAVPAETTAQTQAITISTGETGADRLIPWTIQRRIIAERMSASLRTSPHVTTVMEADLSRVAAHRQANKPAFAKEDADLTYTAYFVAAAAAALKALPLVNSSWSEEGILVHKDINIGLAVSLGEEGLIVPVVKRAAGLSLVAIAKAVNDLSGRARTHKLQTEEVQGGTFTITNHGISGSLFATPIINQPQAAILGVGAIQKRPVVINEDAIAIRPMVYLSLSFDHRILDGSSADGFLAKLIEQLENWGL